jgi:uncharacterized membrane protein
MKQVLLLLLFVSFLLSCQQEKKKLPSVETTRDSLPAVPPADVKKKYSGLFVVGKRALIFKNCNNTDENYFVVDSTRQLAELYRAMFQNSPAFPYEYVYVEVKGIMSPLPDNRMEGFDSVITVKEVLTFEQKNYRNSCIPYDFWAFGGDPDWSLQVSEKEAVIVLKDYAAGAVFFFEYFSPKVVNDEVFTYNSNNYANQTSISAVFKKQPCDNVSNANAYNYSVIIVINGRKYSGCGIRGLPED